MSIRLQQKLVTFVLAGLVAQFLLLGYVLVQSYEGRVTVVMSQREGCVRGKADRKSLAIINKSVTLGFADTDRRNPDPISPERIQAEVALINDLPHLLDRAAINCKDAFPSPSFSPTRGTITP